MVLYKRDLIALNKNISPVIFSTVSFFSDQCKTLILIRKQQLILRLQLNRLLGDFRCDFFLSRNVSDKLAT